MDEEEHKTADEIIRNNPELLRLIEQIKTEDEYGKREGILLHSPELQRLAEQMMDERVIESGQMAAIGYFSFLEIKPTDECRKKIAKLSKKLLSNLIKNADKEKNVEDDSLKELISRLKSVIDETFTNKQKRKIRRGLDRIFDANRQDADIIHAVLSSFTVFDDKDNPFIIGLHLNWAIEHTGRLAEKLC